jgi:ubiquinone/menaquinone biosynthesis C-methylase UbiE
LPALDSKALGLSFGNVAELYDRVRPEYPEEALDLLSSELGLDESATVLDLAAGTGKLTRPLAKRFARVIAVEPNDAMRSLIHGVEAHAGAAERIPLEDASVDAVYVGEAFHWFDGPAALHEIARVLRPRGGLALLWKMWWEVEPPIPEEALELLSDPFVRYGRSAKAHGDEWREAFEESPFDPLREEALADEAEVGSDLLVDMYLTGSSIALLAEAERDALGARLRELLGGRYRIPISVELAWTRLRA